GKVDRIGIGRDQFTGPVVGRLGSQVDDMRAGNFAHDRLPSLDKIVGRRDFGQVNTRLIEYVAPVEEDLAFKLKGEGNILVGNFYQLKGTSIQVVLNRRIYVAQIKQFAGCRELSNLRAIQLRNFRDIRARR